MPIALIRSLIALASVSVTTGAFASPATLQRALNALTAISTVAPDARGTVCQELKGVIAELDADLMANAQYAPVRARTFQAYGIFCAGREDNEGDALIQVNPLVWQGQPVCAKNARHTYRCGYDHSRGRGMLIYERPTAPVLESFLVCAQSAGQSSGLFASGYSITSNCVVSTLDWFAYTNLHPGVDVRSDVRGVLKWEQGRTITHPIQLPKFLADQCATAFSEAVYCSPTLMVLPTIDANVVDVCGLQSSRAAFGLNFIQISSASSRWRCDRFDLRRQTPDNNPISIREGACVPDREGQIHPTCDLPFLPRQQYPIRVRND